LSALRIGYDTRPLHSPTKANAYYRMSLQTRVRSDTAFLFRIASQFPFVIVADPGLPGTGFGTRPPVLLPLCSPEHAHAHPPRARGARKKNQQKKKKKTARYRITIHRHAHSVPFRDPPSPGVQPCCKRFYTIEVFFFLTFLTHHSIAPAGAGGIQHRIFIVFAPHAFVPLTGGRITAC